MRYIPLLLVIALTLVSSCKQDASVVPPAALTPPAPAVAPKTSPPTPSPPSVDVDNMMDLNGDGKPDRYEVVTTNRKGDLGMERELHFFTGADMKPWYIAKAVVLATEHGGMMGDPLANVGHTAKGVIEISHFGGSRQKWTYTHKYRWQDGDFKLIGATITSGAPCDDIVDFDYNLSTARADWKKTSEDCTESESNPIIATMEQSFIRKVELPSMNGFYPGDNKIAIPNVNETVYY